MSDLIKRLRRFAEHEADIADEDKVDRIEWEAADRIDQLERENLKIRSMFGASAYTVDLENRLDEAKKLLEFCKDTINLLQCSTDDYYDSAREASAKGDEAIDKINKVLT